MNRNYSSLHQRKKPFPHQVIEGFHPNKLITDINCWGKRAHDVAKEVSNPVEPLLIVK